MKDSDQVEKEAVPFGLNLGRRTFNARPEFDRGISNRSLELTEPFLGANLPGRSRPTLNPRGTTLDPGWGDRYDPNMVFYSPGRGDDLGNVYEAISRPEKRPISEGKRARAFRSRGKAEGSVQAVYSDPRIVAPITTGPGYFFDGTRRQNIARPETVRVLQTVGQQWEALHPDGPRINVGAVGLTYGGPLPLKRQPGDTRPPFHKSHQNGIDMDIRPMRNDGKEEGVKISDRHYSRALTNELIELFLSQGILRVDKIFFNDRTLIDRYPGVQYQEGHDNHFHIRFIAP